ncbi:MAG: hypothetical protein JWM19_7896 [Actinomycetia bacterium]|nr:hypothetical protein [Actinomycetes bacterium]
MTRQAAIACVIATLAAGAAACSSASSSSSAGDSGTAPGGSPSASGGTSAGGDPLAALSADAIGNKAVADTLAAASVHVTGSGSESGTPLKFSLAMTHSGNCDGSFSEGAKGGFQMILIGKTVWMKPNDTFWKANGGSDPAALSILSGKWIKDSTSSDGLGSMSTLYSLNGLFGSLKSQTTGLVKGTTGIVDGQQTLQLKDGAGAGAGSLYVSDTATPLMVRISDPGSGGGTFDLTDYGASAAITAPPASQTLNGKQYGL